MYCCNHTLNLMPSDLERIKSNIGIVSNVVICDVFVPMELFKDNVGVEVRYRFISNIFDFNKRKTKGRYEARLNTLVCKLTVDNPLYLADNTVEITDSFKTIMRINYLNNFINTINTIEPKQDNLKSPDVDSLLKVIRKSFCSVDRHTILTNIKNPYIVN
ncbi:hypothetical protein [Paraclostridium bifermentans]|uniref:hypothetical protein n=1 Tax=Paraclostridium bifermentans TaxID=1490 RepID=UPI00374E6123